MVTAMLFLIATLISFVMIPGAVAHDRGHHNEKAIWIMAVLFGWTILGWGIALIWACTNPPPNRHEQ